MNARILPNGNLLVPVRVESEDGVVGDAMTEIGPGHPDYAQWHKDLTDPNGWYAPWPPQQTPPTK